MMADLLIFFGVIEFFLLLYLVSMALRIYSIEYKTKRGNWK